MECRFLINIIGKTEYDSKHQNSDDLIRERCEARREAIFHEEYMQRQLEEVEKANEALKSEIELLKEEIEKLKSSK